MPWTRTHYPIILGMTVHSDGLVSVRYGTLARTTIRTSASGWSYGEEIIDKEEWYYASLAHAVEALCQRLYREEGCLCLPEDETNLPNQDSVLKEDDQHLNVHLSETGRVATPAARPAHNPAEAGSCGATTREE